MGRVIYPSLADRNCRKHLIGQAEVRQIAVEVAGCRWKIGCRNRLVAEKSDHVEMLTKAQQFLVVGEISSPAPADPVVHIRRAGYHAEIGLIAAQSQFMFGISGREGKRARRPGHEFENHLGIGKNDLTVLINLCPLALKGASHPLTRHLDPCVTKKVQ